VAACPRCAAALVPGGRFCGECGASVVLTGELSATEAPPIPARPTAPRVSDGVLGRLPLREVLPVQGSRLDLGARHAGPALFASMAIAPFALLQATSGDTGVDRAAVGFAVYFAVLWLVAIHQLVRPEPLGWWVLAGIGAFTAVAGVAIAIAVEEQLGASTDTVIESIVTVGFPEEAAKAVAVLVFLRAGRSRWAPRTYLYAGAVSGLAFGAAEAVTYTTAYASVLDLGDGGLVVSLWRLLCGGLFHACMAGIVAFFIGLGAWYSQVRYHLLAFGLVVAAVLHGLYNNQADGWPGTAIAALTVATFVGYVLRGDVIGARLAQRLST
jgi:RsiW-degrading membrane proteinase PrsW (M82 family)